MPTLPAIFRSKRVITLVASTAVLGTLLTGCTATTSTAGTSTSTPSSTSTSTAPTTTAAGSVVAATEAFTATLTSDQLASLNQEYTLENAEAWSNLPQAMSRNRVGLQLSELDDSQLTALGTLLQAVTGTTAGEGYDEIQQLLNADDYLADNGGGSDYGSGNYFIAFLGTPSDTGTWELQFGGHHFAVANTYTDGVLAGATPSFRGVEPYGTFEQDGETNAPLESEQVALAAVLASLSTDQLSSAELDGVYRDLVLTPGNDWAFPADNEGVQVGTLAADQKALVLAAIATYVNDINDADAATILAKYESELDETYVSYSGGSSLTEQDDYIRIDGPSVWIEFSMQRGIILSGSHPHSVWRDSTTDYGGTQQQ
ncbi:DUF3500 domain-containing protein [Cryobacterium cryoconiti]|uniref:DUF3500 domain-containing protein n=1 Tax=Cryobacterium cryoconiti TaxID=1259239 RepID=A0A4Y8K0V1_9MICO|nr:DUF3500 domain-containing protein [Cryobacterium cryoconiti]TFD32069.1 DUF3500 domain-containing protein [Cryobacterium cryoconiti]